MDTTFPQKHALFQPISPVRLMKDGNMERGYKSFKDNNILHDLCNYLKIILILK